MLSVITNGNRSVHRNVISAMHVDRKRVFVDRLKWNVPVVDGKYEIDQFDTEDAVYLVAADPETGAHWGSVRLLPSTKPHILGSLYPHLCDGDVPVGEAVWEITRLCTSPDLNGSWQQVRVWRGLALGCIEYGLAAGIERYTLVTHMKLVPTVLSAMWNCTPLGLPRPDAGVDLCALAIDVDEPTLHRMRESYRADQPLAGFADRPRQKAA